MRLDWARRTRQAHETCTNADTHLDGQKSNDLPKGQRPVLVAQRVGRYGEAGEGCLFCLSARKDGGMCVSERVVREAVCVYLYVWG